MLNKLRRRCKAKIAAVARRLLVTTSKQFDVACCGAKTLPQANHALTSHLVRHSLDYTRSGGEIAVTIRNPKRDRLRRQGLLNPEPQQVQAPWFQTGEFFDADDLLQAKYEMLRHVRVDGVPKGRAAALFGMSRPTFYQAEAAFARDGLAGLLPKPRGPKGAHKLTEEVMAFIEQRLHKDGSIHARALAQDIESTLGISVHPRSIERAILRKKKA
jgi:transposase